ncbi:MAG: hypothetical protein OC190_16440 [Novosphingobium aromaticivorans]|nr:hypothetical protein [Novosphingobium aromaticivorans]
MVTGHPPRALGDEAQHRQNARKDEQRAQDKNLHPAGKRRKFRLLGGIHRRQIDRGAHRVPPRGKSMAQSAQ